MRVEGSDGKAISGVRVEARLIFFSGGTGNADMPGSLAAPLAVNTGQDGTATIAFLRGKDQLTLARVTAEAIGAQELPVTEEPHERSAASAFVISFKKTSRLSGRIVDPAGHGVAGQTVEIWSRRPDPCRARSGSNGPLPTGPDGFSDAGESPDRFVLSGRGPRTG